MKKLGFCCTLLMGIAIFYMRTQDKIEPITITVERKDFVVDVSSSGKLHACESAIISYLSTWDSYITKMVPEGTFVKKGDVVMEFTDNELRGWVRESELYVHTSQLAKDESALHLAAERERMNLEIEKLKIDIKITALALEELRNYPSATELEIAENKYRHSLLVKEIAQQEYDKFTQSQQAKYITTEERHALENALQQAKKKYDLAKSEREVVRGGKHPYHIKQLQIEMKKKRLALQEIEQQIDNRLKKIQKQVVRQQAQLQEAQHQLQRARQEYQHMKLRAPIDGIVLYLSPFEQKIAIGQNAWRGVELMRIANIQQMEVRCGVLENEIHLIKKGQKATVYVAAMRASGTVVKIGKLPIEADKLGITSRSGIKVFEVSVVVKEANRHFLPQMDASVDIHIHKQKNVLVIPSFVITQEQQRNVVYTLDGKKEITIANRNNHEAMIEKGVRVGEKIILGDQQ
ncbi:efflux RND transporter periplasmic adaptor subunit [Candidatus Uabimicrobium amorphum]|uniref:Secretion protein HlyD n=1 Tax=Uabimicrobium amorphum TaxID=2596890 RepID=A0A5S9F181_UABAM|nr:efflux RND transporter periplasmic adaptor subunit [Candidatus Uabimicrobium amorphum]BBM82112.1 secretion protein HlyD [Candidatus Uabimicrobium amorphum]